MTPDGFVRLHDAPISDLLHERVRASHKIAVWPSLGPGPGILAVNSAAVELNPQITEWATVLHVEEEPPYVVIETTLGRFAEVAGTAVVLGEVKP